MRLSPFEMKSVIISIRHSAEIVESSRVRPNAPIPNQRVFKFGEATLIASMTPLRNQGLATARPFDTAINKHELNNIFFISGSIIRLISAFLISDFVACLSNKLVYIKQSAF